MHSYASFSSRHKQLFKILHVLAVRRRHVQKDDQNPVIQLHVCSCLPAAPGPVGPV